jgi:hypothetical protein
MENIQINIEQSQNWMTKMYPFIKNKPLNHIFLPGTHNSGVNVVNWNIQPVLNNSNFQKVWKYRFFPCVKHITNQWTITQNNSIYGQLIKGIRYLDIRVSFINNEFYISHTYICYELDLGLNDILRFLQQQPNEVIILRLNRDWENRQTMTADNTELLLNYLYNKLGKYLIKKPTNNIFPTFETILKTNGRILMYYHSNHNDKSYIWNSEFVNSGWMETLDTTKKLNYLQNKLDQMVKSNINLNILDFTLTAGVNDIVNDVISRFLKPFSTHKGLEGVSMNIQELLPKFLNKNGQQLDKISIIIADFPSNDFITDIIKLNYIL